MKRLEEYDVFSLPVADIYYDQDFNCRGQFTLQSVKDLADSIQENRLQFPVVVQPVADVVGKQVPTNYGWRLLAGHRRYMAVTRFLKWDMIPASVRRGLTAEEAAIFNLTENLERKDLNPLEEALALRNLFPEGTSLRVAARKVKKDTKWVHARFRILKLPEPIQQLVAARRITLLDIETIYQQPPERQVEAAEAIAEAKLGRGKRPRFKGQRFVRSFKRRKSKVEINDLITKMLNLGIDSKQPLAPRVAAWCAGYLSDDQIDQDLDAFSATGDDTGRTSSDAT